MTWGRRRVLWFIGVLCLLGQGTLLYVSGMGSSAPRLLHPGLLLVASIGLVVFFICGWFVVDRRRGWIQAWGVFPAIALVVLVLLAILAPARGPFWSPAVPTLREGPDREEMDLLLTRLKPLLDQLAGPLAPDFLARYVNRSEETGQPDLTPVGDLFRTLADWAGVWEGLGSRAQKYSLGIILWQADQRLAWTSGAEPLLADIPPNGVGWDNVRRHFVKGRSGYYFVERRTLPGGLQAEFQIFLYAMEATAASPVAGRVQAAQQLLAMELAWLLALAGAGWFRFGTRGLIGGLWLGRLVLAAMDILRWTAVAFPHWTFPAAPTSVASLVDPAYFATPFLAGMFASTADAVFTAVLVILTAGQLVARGPFGAPGLRPFTWEGERRGRVPTILRALVFGLLVGAALLGMRSLAGHLAENANARLVGTGIALSYLSFWGLHLVLMLISFSLTVCSLRVAGARSYPTWAHLPAWLGLGFLAGAVALLLARAVIQVTPATGILVLGVVVGLWMLCPALWSGSPLWRRSVWPAVLLLTVVWNYQSLRAVYDHAERGWLDRKGSLITAAGEDWLRYLLQDLMTEMRERDAAINGPGSDQTVGLPTRPVSPVYTGTEDLWRDEPAFMLWRDSALQDLDLACLVEIIDDQGVEESLFTRGFLRDYQYEISWRSDWVRQDGDPTIQDGDIIFQVEIRNYLGGQEEVLAAEVVRSEGRGWIRVEIPLRSWRIPTLLASLIGTPVHDTGRYRPRAEVDRPVLLVRGDQEGWLAAGEQGFPSQAASQVVHQLQQGQSDLAEIELGGKKWLCLWKPLPREIAQSPGEGFLLGLQRPTLADDLLDLSRLMLLNILLLLLLAFFFLSTRPASVAGEEDLAHRSPWRSGFQEKFLAGFMALGLILLVVTGMAIDKVGYDRVRGEAKARTRAGLSLAEQQLRSLLVEQAGSLARSEYIADLLANELSGQRPIGPLDRQQGMVFAADGRLLLDETLSNLDSTEAAVLLREARHAPLLFIVEPNDFFVATVIPIDLGDVLADFPEQVTGHGANETGGFFLYRQRMDSDLLGSLAELVQGQVTVSVDGMPMLASHPAPFFQSQAPLLTDPGLLGELLDHPAGPGVFAAEGRPFAFTGCRALPVLAKGEDNRMARRRIPAVLAVSFPDREREYIAQRRHTVLFIAGLANLVLLGAILLAQLMSWNIFRPLRMLVSATRGLARGDFAVPLPESGSDEVGRLAGAFALMRCELQSARDSLAAREQFLTTVLDRVPVGVAVLSASGEVMVLNPSGQQILKEFDPVHGQRDGVMLLLDKFRDLAPGKVRSAGELRGRDGRRTLRGAMAPLDLPDGRTDAMLVFEDITEFLENKKMALHAELARQVAHEIKNPLTPIQLSIQLLDQAWRDQHPQLDRIMADTVARILDQVNLLHRIAAEFSLLGRPGNLEMTSVDLMDLVRNVVATYGDGEDSPRVTIQAAELPPVHAEADSLQKILGNLMQNSLDAAGQGQSAEVAIDWLVDGETVTLFWRDRGPGLSSEVADRLFDPYFSTKSKGTGLGLAICRNLVDRMQGSITLTNRTDGPGAVAALTLPLFSE